MRPLDHFDAPDPVRCETCCGLCEEAPYVCEACGHAYCDDCRRQWPELLLGWSRECAVCVEESTFTTDEAVTP